VLRAVGRPGRLVAWWAGRLPVPAGSVTVRVVGYPDVRRYPRVQLLTEGEQATDRSLRSAWYVVCPGRDGAVMPCGPPGGLMPGLGPRDVSSTDATSLRSRVLSTRTRVLPPAGPARGRRVGRDWFHTAPDDNQNPGCIDPRYIQRVGPPARRSRERGTHSCGVDARHGCGAYSTPFRPEPPQDLGTRGGVRGGIRRVRTTSWPPGRGVQRGNPPLACTLPD